MNGLLVAGITATATIAAVLAWAIRWALDKKGLLPTTQMLLNFTIGCCIVVAFGVWIVKGLSLLRGFGTGEVSAVLAALIVLIPVAAAAICGIFFVYCLHPKHKPDSRDQTAALVLPIALMLISGALGAVGDSLSKGTSEIAVNVTTKLVGGNGKAIIPDREASAKDR